MITDAVRADVFFVLYHTTYLIVEILRDGKARATIPESAPPRWFGMANGGSRR